jgi:hypothetical protein
MEKELVLAVIFVFFLGCFEPALSLVDIQNSPRD